VSTGIEDQVLVVTGAGRGIGRAHCLALARRSARVVVNDVAAAYADEVVREIEAAGGSAVASYASVATPEGAAEIVSTGVERFGTVDGVINNAGFMRNGLFEDQTPQMLDSVLGVHVHGSFFVTQAAWPIMRAKGYGRVVMTSSAGGLFAMQGEANYAAAKAATYGLMRALAFEGRPLGILVNAVLPHAATTMTKDDPVPAMGDHMAPGLAEALAPRRLAGAVAPLVAFLASPACTLSGEAFAAGCGRFARVFVGETQGWVAPPDGELSPEDVAAHLEEITALEGFEIPTDLYAEIEMMGRAIGWRSGPS
jgi:NAD(P)-dependent dehydrogenase (short-subunit alcohol dehydrogenase family)